MNEYNLYGDGSGSMAMEYPKSDNNGSVSDAPTIPKDGDHLEGGLVENVERHQIENPELARALTVVKEYCAIGQESKSAEDGRQALERAYASSANGDLRRGRKRYCQCSGNFGLIWDICGRHGGY
jgi:hypothetical protein